MAKKNEDFEDKLLDDILEPFILSNEMLTELKDGILKEIDLSLKVESHSTTDLKCYPTWIQDLPTRCEHGKFLVVSLSKAHFHLAFIYLKGANKGQLEPQSFDIPEQISKPDELFNLIVDKMNLFIRKLHLERNTLPIALVLTQPLKSININTAAFLKFRKKEQFFGMEAKEIGNVMQVALRRVTDCYVDLVTIINDISGILVSGAYSHDNCKMSVIVDERCKMAYMERTKNIETLEDAVKKPHMIVNTMLGEYGTKGQLEFIQTSYDKELDEEGDYKGYYLFEKMVTPQNLTELIRKVILKAIENNVLFDGNHCAALEEKNSLKWEQMQNILSENDNFYDTQLIFKRMGITLSSQNECSKIYKIIKTVTMRSAHLIAAVMSAIVERLQEPQITIAIDGVLYCTVEMYHEWIEETMMELIPPHCALKLVHSMDKYGHGAALVSAMELRKLYMYEEDFDCEN